MSDPSSLSWLMKPGPDELSDLALADVAAERRSQIRTHGFATDDEYTRRAGFPLRSAAVSYIGAGIGGNNDLPSFWPWGEKHWKPRTQRENLVRAAALIIAEIERLDRAEVRARREDRS